MSISISIADYVLLRLKGLGVTDVFGVAGDYVLDFLNAVVNDDGLTYRGCSNELNAAYATDGYSRVNGFGCLAVTFGVGEFSALNGVACAAAEKVPMLVLVGIPPSSLLDSGSKRVHHTVHSLKTGCDVFKNICAASVIIDSVERAASEIDKILIQAIKHSAPVYCAIPTDLMSREIILPEVISEIDIMYEYESDQEALATAVGMIAAKLSNAQSPILLLGRDIRQKKLEAEISEIVEQGDIQFTTMKLVKDVVSESHRNFLGNVTENVAEINSKSDLKVLVGSRLNDVNTFGFHFFSNDDNCIRIAGDGVCFGASRVFRNVNWVSVVKRLVGTGLNKHKDRIRIEVQSRKQDVISSNISNNNAQLTLHEIKESFESHVPFDNVAWVYDVGASTMELINARHGFNCLSLSQDYYLSIGYALPATLGACIALLKPDVDKSNYGSRRESKSKTEIENEFSKKNLRTDLKRNEEIKTVVCVIGDGGLQMTATELSSLFALKNTPYRILVVVINNDGYSVERAICDNEYNDIGKWNYSLLPRAFGCHRDQAGVIAKTKDELIKALQTEEPFTLIEAIVDKWDISSDTLKLGESLREANSIRIAGKVSK